MKDTEKLEIILTHLSNAQMIPTYCEDYVRQGIMRALREISAAEMEEASNVAKRKAPGEGARSFKVNQHHKFYFARYLP